MNGLPVSELYGPVVQGEGEFAGRPVHFLRLGLCNLRCEWCDTPYTWDARHFDLAAENPTRDAATIIDGLPRSGIVVLSGGEPLIHQHNDALREVMEARPNLQWHVETNGTLHPDEWLQLRVRHWAVSPKLAHAGDSQKRRIRGGALAAFAVLASAHRAAWKIVLDPSDGEQVAEALGLVDDFAVPRDRVWLMAVGATRDAQLERAADLERVAVTHGVNVSPRLHVLAHGHQRGV